MSGLVLVAGGTGRLGSLVVCALAKRGAPVRVLTRDPKRAAHLAGPHVEVVTGDVRDAASLGPAAAGAKVIVSAVQGFAGPGGVTPDSVDRQGNVNLIEAARVSGAEMVLMSGVGVAADSSMELFRAKCAAEGALADSGVPATVVRATAFLELWLDLLRETAGKSQRPLVFGRGQNPINFVSVRDVAALVDEVIADPSARGHTLEIGGPENLTLDHLARLTVTALGGSKPPRHLPRPVLRTMASTVGRIRPEVGRQVRAALAMDSVDLTFDGAGARNRYPGLPCTSVANLLSVRTG